MSESETNIKALELSPQFWWRAFDRAIQITDGYAKALVPDFDFRKWLAEGIIEHDSTVLRNEEDNRYFTNQEYEDATKNSYFYRVGFVNRNGVKLTAKTIEDLRQKYDVQENDKTFYTFRITDLNHFVSLYFQHWLLFNTYFDWVRWQHYYNFIVSKADKRIGDLFQNMWHTIMIEVDFYSHAFKDVKQYKQFRNKLDETGTISNFVQDEYIKWRDGIAKK